MIGENPECFGRKRCPRGASSFGHALCSINEECTMEVARRMMKRTNSLMKTYQAVEEHHNVPGKSGTPANKLLIWIAGVADELGIKFSYKQVKRVVDKSDIMDSLVAMQERKEVYEAFGVRKTGATRAAKTCAIGKNIEPSKPVSAKTQAPLSDLSFETKRPVEAKFEPDFHPIETQDKKGGFS